MPKRKRNDAFQYLANKIKKLEKKLKVSNRHRQLKLSSGSSESSESSSTSSSRNASPTPPPYSPLSERGHNDISPATITEPATAQIPTIPEPTFLEDKTSSAGVIEEPTIVEKDDTFDEIAPANSEPGLDSDLLDILGTDPSNIEEYGPNINHELASRLNFIATHGLDKDNRRELLQKYLTPSNCKDLSAPILNPEIKAATPDYIVKRDRSIEINQKQIAAAITCLGNIMSTQISSSGRDSELLKSLMDASRILCDVQHMQSKARRAYALYSLKKDLKEQLNNTKIDRFLFGQDLAETIKTAKAVSRSSIDLKVEIRRRPKQSRNLNQKPGPGSRRAAPGPQRYHHQPSTTTRPMSSYLPPTPPSLPPTSSVRGQPSTASSYRPRQTRRR